jgi:hypothetical protein
MPVLENYYRQPWGIVPPPELLELFEPYGPEATLEVLRNWRDEHRADFIYSTLALLIAGFLGFGLIGG